MHIFSHEVHIAGKNNKRDTNKADCMLWFSFVQVHLGKTNMGAEDSISITITIAATQLAITLAATGFSACAWLVSGIIGVAVVAGIAYVALKALK